MWPVLSNIHLFQKQCSSINPKFEVKIPSWVNGLIERKLNLMLLHVGCSTENSTKCYCDLRYEFVHRIYLSIVWTLRCSNAPCDLLLSTNRQGYLWKISVSHYINSWNFSVCHYIIIRKIITNLHLKTPLSSISW